MSATIRINGRDERLAAATVAELLRIRGIDKPRGIAVAVNGAIVPARRWSEVALAPGDAVEIVKPFGGG
ncbi:MAG: sulfur carrier protein ThiS [Alphaproteobacteria bacterium]|nr:sulfur carrier protein ThiS [Alphaproteobacteria bacterium]